MYCVRGYPATLSVVLDSNYGNNVTYEVYDSKNQFVQGGSAIQNRNHPTEFNAVITIPESAYCENDGSKYQIEWKTSQGFVRDSFLVFPQGEPVPKSCISICMPDEKITSIFSTPFKATSLKAKLYNYAGELLEVKEKGSECYVQVGNNYKYDVEFITPASINDTMGAPYVVMWEYHTPAGSGMEMFQVYVPNFRMLKWVNDAKQYLDLLDLNEINPRLRITPEILMPFIGMAMDRINGIGTATRWSVVNFPTNLDYAMQMCLRHEYLNARYLAEGMCAFDFQGASTQLNVDRTQYIQTKMDEIGNWLEQNLKELKNNAVRGGSAGVINLSYTPCLNWCRAAAVSNYWTGMATRILGY